MAKETIISIKTGQAVQSIGDLRENIKEYKKQLDNANLSAGEHHAILARLQENQAALRNAMHATTATFTDITNAATAANVAFDKNNKLIHAESLSYNELVRELDILKQQWRATTNAAERSQLTERISAVNNQLKGLDESVGVFGRNVGNYIGAVDHLMNGLAGMGRGASALVGPLRGVTMGLKTMSATPAIAILGVLANILQKVMDAMNGAEDSSQGLAKALAPFKALGDMVTRALQGVADVVVGLVGWFGKLTTAILGNNDAANERLRIAKQEAELAKQQRETLISNAEAERDIAELRAKSSEKEKYTASERLAFLQEAGEKEKEIFHRAYEDMQNQYKIIKAKNALTESSKEEKDAEARAYADMIKAQTAYFMKMREINAGITEARSAEVKAARDAAKAVKDAATAKINAEKEYLNQLLSLVEDGSKKQMQIENTIAKMEYEKAVAEARQKITNEEDLQRAITLLRAAFYKKVEKNQEDHNEKQRQQELLGLENIMNGYDKGSADYLALQVQLREREYDTLTKMQGENDQQFLARRIESFRALLEARQQFQDKEVADSRKSLETQLTLAVDYSQFEDAAREAQAAMDNIQQEVGESDADFYARRLAARQAYEDAVQQLDEAALARERTGLAEVENQKLESLMAAVQLAQFDLDNLRQQEGESADEFLARRLEAQQAFRDAERALTDAQTEDTLLAHQNKMTLLEENSLEYLSLEVELKRMELDTLHRMEGESNEEFRSRQLEAEKAYNDAQKKLSQGRVNIMQSYAGAVSGLMSSIADIYETNTENDKDAAEKAKNLRIAGATIDTISGAIGAYMSAQQQGLPPAISIPLGIISAASVTAAGMANIAKIRSTEVSTTSSSSTQPVIPASVEAPTATPQVQEVRTLTGVAEQEELNKAQRVYILSSDLEADQQARQVQLAETSW